MAEAADQHHRLAQYLRQAAAMPAHLLIEPDSPVMAPRRTLVPVFITVGATSVRSVPTKWVTDHSGDMGNTFGPKGFSIGSSLHVSRTK